jgi:hypothetical protein
MQIECTLTWVVTGAVLNSSCQSTARVVVPNAIWPVACRLELSTRKFAVPLVIFVCGPRASDMPETAALTEIPILSTLTPLTMGTWKSRSSAAAPLVAAGSMWNREGY